MTTKEIVERCEKRMQATVEDAKHKLATVRTGRASLSLLDGVRVEYYGTPTPLNQVAKLSIPEPALILAQPFDPSTVPAIEKAILAADLGLNPSNDGKMVRIPVPPLTEERRKQLVKKVRSLAEDARTALRQVRREANEELRRQEKDGHVSEDEARRALEDVQARTDRRGEEIDALSLSKEKELMEI
ncbi:MAG TPA: ribosome recycling factor [Candidatus Polarisedimenticolaceae bacterium]|nr:ribosome recycling factor [Candidatus Polarisedimenticolaceae bacterium]